MLKHKVSSICLLLILGIIVMTIPVYSYNNFTLSTFVNWTAIPELADHAGQYFSVQKILTADNNDVYVFFKQGPYSNAVKYTKYTYATGTWSTPQNLLVGGSDYSYYGYDIEYKNGTFHILYKSNYNYDYGLYNLFYTSTTNLASIPAGTQLPGYTSYNSYTLHVRDDGKTAIFYASRMFSNTYYVYSNYSGSWVSYNLGSPQNNVYTYSTYFSGDNLIIAYATYESGEINYYYTNSASWNGSTWSLYVSPGPAVLSNPSPSIFIPEKTPYYSQNGYGVNYVKNYKGTPLMVGTYQGDEYYFRYIRIGDYIQMYTGSTPPIHVINGITKFNSPDGKIMVIGSDSAGKLKYGIFDYMEQQPVFLISKTTDTIAVKTLQGNNTSLSTTNVQVSNKSDMSAILESQSHGNYGATSASYTSTFAGLLPSTRYFFQSEVVDNPRSIFSDIREFITLPAIPANVTFTNVGSTSLSINFNGSLNGVETIYLIERSLTGNPSGTDWAQVYSGPDTNFTDTGLTAKTIYYYRVRAKNPADEWSSYTFVNSIQTLDRDNVAPTVSLSTNNGGAILYDAFIPIKLVVGDNRTSSSILTYSYSFNNGSWSAPVAVGVTNGVINLSLVHGMLTSGDLTMQVKVYDEDGNVGIASSRVYYQKASELPAAPLNVPIVAGESNVPLTEGTINGKSVFFSPTNSVNLNFAAQDAPFYQVSTDNGAYTDYIDKTKEIDLNLGANGIHTVKIRMVNSAGIGGTEQEVKVLVDTIKPSFDIKTPLGAKATRDASMSIVIAATDNISSIFTYNLNGGAYQVLPDDGIVSIPLALGVNSIVIGVKDQAGNTCVRTIGIWRI